MFDFRSGIISFGCYGPPERKKNEIISEVIFKFKTAIFFFIQYSLFEIGLSMGVDVLFSMLLITEVLRGIAIPLKVLALVLIKFDGIFRESWDIGLSKITMIEGKSDRGHLVTPGQSMAFNASSYTDLFCPRSDFPT